MLDPVTGETVSKAVRCAGTRIIGGLTMALLSTTNHLAHHLLKSRMLGTDPHTRAIDSLQPLSIGSEFALKAKSRHDPDLPSVHEALTGNHSKEFFKAMDKEILDLESMGTWEIIARNQLPSQTKVIPSTWAMRIKRFPDGRLNKFKERFCVRGDLMTKGMHYDESYSPVCGWPTIRASLILAALLNLHTCQVDFQNAFCQAAQKDPLYIELSQHYKVQGREEEDLVLSLKKSLYGTVTAPKLFYEHVQAGMLSEGFVQSKSDPCLFIHAQHQVFVLQYVDDQIWMAKDPKHITQHLEALQNKQFLVTIKGNEDMFGFLGIDCIKRKDGTIELSQEGLIRKTLKCIVLDVYIEIYMW